MPQTPVPPATLMRGMLLDAFHNGHTLPLHWTEVTVGPLVVTVAADAMKAPLGEHAAVRLPVSYAETIEICRALDCLPPTKAICDAMFAQARAQLHYVGLVRTAQDSKKMRSAEFTLRFDARVEEQRAKHVLQPTDLVFGAWKLWLFHPKVTVRGAVNYGFWDTKKRPPKPIQSPGTRHDAAHYDYSQLLQPVRREARRVSDGTAVDLLAEIAGNRPEWKRAAAAF